MSDPIYASEIAGMPYPTNPIPRIRLTRSSNLPRPGNRLTPNIHTLNPHVPLQFPLPFCPFAVVFKASLSITIAHVSQNVEFSMQLPRTLSESTELVIAEPLEEPGKLGMEDIFIEASQSTR